MPNLSKENVLENTGGTWETTGQICCKMATRMKRTVTVSDVKVLLFQLADEGLVETYLRGDTLHYRKA